MKFRTPSSLEFTIPDDWWQFAEMNSFSPNGGGYYPYPFQLAEAVTVVNLCDVEPPKRDDGVPPFKKYKLLPVLFAFQSPDCALPPVEAKVLAGDDKFRYGVLNGYHRYYASVAVGYSKLPIAIRSQNAL